MMAWGILASCILAATQDLPDQPWFPRAPRLPEPAGQVIRVSDVEQLFQAARNVKPRGAILLADGHYRMERFFTIATDGVTMRSASGDRNKVVLDGSKSRHGELVGIRGADVTVADLTIANIKWNGFKIMEFGTHRARIYNCVIRNVWQRGVKASHVPEDKLHLSPRECRVQFCLFFNDRPKKFSDDETEKPERFNGNYIGGIDVKNTIGWTISDNVFVGIHGRTGEGRGAIYISENGRDCVIERNVFIDCDVGIALGNPTLGYSPFQAVDCVVRNNFVTRCHETGILADYTKGCRILHNTIHDPASRLRRLILIQDRNEDLVVANNLLSGPPIQTRSKEGFALRGNVVRKDLAELFVDVKAGNLRLKRPREGITNAAARLPLVSHDVDSQPRLNRPDVGADEWGGK